MKKLLIFTLVLFSIIFSLDLFGVGSLLLAQQTTVTAPTLAQSTWAVVQKFLQENLPLILETILGFILYLVGKLLTMATTFILSRYHLEKYNDAVVKYENTLLAIIKDNNQNIVAKAKERIGQKDAQGNITYTEEQFRADMAELKQKALKDTAQRVGGDVMTVIEKNMANMKDHYNSWLEGVVGDLKN